MALTKRLVKGSAITAAEHDANLDHVMDLGNATGELALASVADIGSGDNLLLTAAERGKLADLAASIDTQLGSTDWRSGGGGGYTEEEIQDIVGAMLSGEEIDGLTVTYDDAGNAVSYELNDGVVIRQTPWDASTGSFPADAQNGYRYLVSTGGTVDGTTFVAGDYLLAIADDASTTTYAGNWERIATAPSRYATAAQGLTADTPSNPRPG